MVEMDAMVSPPAPPAQISFAGFTPSGPPSNRLFLAIFAEGEASAAIAHKTRQLIGEHRLTGRPLLQDRLHTTIFHLGDYPELPDPVVACAMEAAAALRMAPFDVAFDRVESFASKAQNNPFVLRGGDGLASLIVFQQKLGLELMKVSLGKWVKPGFTPHVTMLYDRRRVPTQLIEPIGWRVTRFVLVHSLLGKTEHRRLGEWELIG